MSTFQSFEEIEAWQRGRSLTRKIREVCKREKVKRDFAWIDQITRAVRSIGANIAEGFESLTIPEFINSLGYAKRSSGEVRSHLYDGSDEGYISQKELDELSNETIEICKMLAGLIHYLQSMDKKKKRTLKNQKTQLITKD